MSHDPNCIFCKIVEGKIPSRKVYEDDEVLGFHDIAPWAPVHFLLIPKQHIESLYETDPGQHAALLGKMLALAPKLAREQGVVNGFRALVNTGPDGHQEVPHLHLHVIGGPRPWAKG
ncbi:MAG: histidine triad nucleotide-binding protein [Ideonella sp.]